MSVDNARVLVVGDVAVGKTSLIRYLSQKKAVTDPPPPTVGCELEVLLHVYESNDQRDTGHLGGGSPWDLRQLDRGRREPKEYFVEFLEVGATHAHAVTRRMFYHDYSGIILVYDTTSPRSCQRLLYWRQEIQKHSFERQEVPDGTFPYARLPESIVTGDDRRQSSTRKNVVPVLVVGTKADAVSGVTPEHRGWIDKVIKDSSATEISVSTKRPSDISPGTKSFEVFQSFLNKVIETKFFHNATSPQILPVSPTMRARARSFNSKNRSVAM